MKKLSKVFALLILACSLMVIFASCAENPYKDYISSGLQAKAISLGFDENESLVLSLPKEQAKIFVDYESYAACDFPLDYAETFFEENNLLVFTTIASSSDEMKFLDILTYEGELYPCYSRVKLGPNDAIAEDILFFPYCAEFAKSDDLKLGEVIYQYR